MTAPTVDAIVEECIRDFPQMCENRTQVLHDLFCVLGNGYRWQGGALVYQAHKKGRTEEAALRPLLATPSAFLAKYDPQEYQREAREYAAERERLRDIRARAAELARTPGPLEREPYSWCEELHIENLPDDIRPDWAAAAAEIGAVVRPLWAAKALTRRTHGI